MLTRGEGWPLSLSRFSRNLPELRRREPGVLPEHVGEVTLIGKSRSERNLRQGAVCVGQLHRCPFDPEVADVLRLRCSRTPGGTLRARVTGWTPTAPARSLQTRPATGLGMNHSRTLLVASAASPADVGGPFVAMLPPPAPAVDPRSQSGHYQSPLPAARDLPASRSSTWVRHRKPPLVLRHRVRPDGGDLPLIRFDQKTDGGARP